MCSQTGSTFLEIIITLCLLSASYLGLARLDILSLHIHYLAYQRSVAATQMISIIHRLKANHLKISEEVIRWNEQNQMVLPMGKGSVVCSASNCKIQLQWQYRGEKKLTKIINLAAEDGF